MYTRAINAVHLDLFNSKINHSEINKMTDITFTPTTTTTTTTINNVSYRLYSIDYGSYFYFKHNVAHLLYSGKKHWRQEQKEKALVITS